MSFYTKIMIIFFVAYSSYTWSADMSKSQFTEKFNERLVVEFPKTSFRTLSELRIYTNNINGYELNIFLDNAYYVFLSNKRTLKEVFDDQINSIKNQQQSFNSKGVKNIIPVLKSKGYIEATRKQLYESGYDKKELPFFYEKLNDDLFILYVFDMPESMSFVSPDDVKKLEVDGFNIRNIAKNNLDAYYIKIGISVSKLDTKGQGNIFLLKVDDNYEASALLSSKIWNKENFPVEGSFVAFIPAKNIMFIAGSEDIKGIETAMNLSFRGYSELGYSISPYGYINKDQKWIRFEF